jgi:hypothetical protein
MRSDTMAAREARIRRALARDGQRLWTPRGRHAAEYGPYAVIDNATNTIGSHGQTLDTLEAQL